MTNLRQNIIEKINYLIKIFLEIIKSYSINFITQTESNNYDNIRNKSILTGTIIQPSLPLVGFYNQAKNTIYKYKLNIYQQKSSPINIYIYNFFKFKNVLDLYNDHFPPKLEHFLDNYKISYAHTSFNYKGNSLHEWKSAPIIDL